MLPKHRHLHRSKEAKVKKLPLGPIGVHLVGHEQYFLTQLPKQQRLRSPSIANATAEHER